MSSSDGPPHGRKATIPDIAAAAGVGTATVERVLNGRGNVSQKTVESVLIAAKKLSYWREVPFRHHGVVRIEIIMVQPRTVFFRRLSDAFEHLSDGIGGIIQLHRTFLDESDPIHFAAYIRSPPHPRSGLIVVAPDHPAVLESLTGAKKAGVAVTSIVTRVGPRGVIPHIGIDDYAVGRTAGYFLCRMSDGRRGSILSLCHSGVYSVARERMRGFSDHVQAHLGAGDRFPLILLHRDEPRLAARLLFDAMEAYPDIKAIYSAGGANDGIADVLYRHTARKDILWVGHEFTPQTGRYMKDGLLDVLFDQAPEQQARRAVDFILAEIGYKQAPVPRDPVQFVTMTAEMLGS